MFRASCLSLMLALACMTVAACATSQPSTPMSTAAPMSTPFPTATATPRPTPTVPPTISVTPTVIPYPKPDLSVDLQVLRNAGCAIDWGRYHGAWVCPDNAAIKALGCDTLAPDNLFAGLTPYYPVLRCRTFQSPPPDQEHFRCMDYSYGSYLLFKDGQYRLISNQSELKDLFAPVESADEALAFALVTTDLAAKFSLARAGGEYYAEAIEGTHVIETPEGYVVHLFDNPERRCGCTTYVTSAVDVLVTRDGHVTISKSEPAYGNSACVDCGMPPCP